MMLALLPLLPLLPLLAFSDLSLSFWTTEAAADAKPAQRRR